MLAALLTAGAGRASGQTPRNAVPRFFLTSFSPSVPGGFWLFVGDSPTNLTSLTGDPPLYRTADFRDSCMMQLNENYYVVFNDEQSNSCRIIVSADLTNWCDHATLFVPPRFGAFWSPKFVTDDLGHIYLTAFVQDSNDWNYYMGVGVMSSDLKVLQDFRIMHLSRNPANWETDPNSSAVYFHNGVYYLFTGDGNEYTSADILADDWAWLEDNLPVGAGKSVAEWNGLFYLTATELGSQNWSISSDLVTWTNLSISDALTPSLGTVGREGCFYVQMVPDGSAEAVPLTIARSGGSVVLSWPASGSQTLEQSSDLADWVTNAAPVLTINGTSFVTIAAPPGNRFFRLAQ